MVNNVDPASLQAIVHGRVHGVFFRASVETRAEELKLTGFVRNRPDGTVEVRAEGERQKLEKLVEYLKKGPPAASVEEVVVTWAAYTGDYSQFSIRY
jgi:acylphosphatase